MLRRALSLLWFAAAALLILMAVAFSAARLLLPLMGDQRAQLETRLETLLQHPVRIERMDAAWRGFGPTLQLRGLRILDAPDGAELLALDALWLHLDLFSSLRERALVTSDASLVGMDLDIVRRPDGRIGLRDMPPPERALSLEAVLGILHSLGEVELLHTRLHWEDQTGAIPGLAVDDVTLRLEARDRALWADLDIPLPAAYGERLRVSLRLEGEAARPDELDGRFFLQFEDLHLGAWSSLLPRRNLDIWGRLDLRVWGHWQDGRPRELAVDIGLRDTQLASLAGGDVSPFFFSRLDGLLLWTPLQDGWRLSARRFEVEENGVHWPASDWQLEHRVDGDDVIDLRGTFAHIDLGVLSRLLQALSLPVVVEEPLHAMQPTGRFTDLRFATRIRDGLPESLRLRTAFHDLHSRPHGQLPGIQGWSGQVDGDLEHGTLRLDIDAGALEQALFRDPLPLAQAGGEVHWRRGGERLSLYSNHFRIANAEVAGSGHFRLDLPDPLGAARPMPYLALQFQVERGQAAHTGRYLPVGIMNDKAVAWLDRAIVAGDITRGAVLFHGPLRGFPFDARQGRFEVRAEVRDAVLDYQEGWAPIHDLHAELAFTDAGMEILGRAGRIGATRLADVRAWAPDLRAAGPPLRITGQAAGALEDMQDFLRDSPLGARFQGLTGDMRLTGAAGLELALRIPLRAAQGDVAVQGRLTLADNGLSVEGHDLVLAGLRGELGFTEASVSGQGLRARLWDTPLAIDLDTVTRRDDSYHRIRLQGRPDLFTQLRAWGWPLPAGFEGVADWRSEVRIYPARQDAPARLYLELASDLRGIGLDLPAPLGKAADSARSLRLWRTREADEDGPVWLHYGDVLRAVLDWETGEAGMRLKRAGIHLGDGTARLPAAAVVQLGGRLPRLSVSEWRAFLDGNGAGDHALPPLEIDLQLAELEIYRRELRDVGVQLRRRDGVWDARLSGQGAQGSVQFSNGSGSLERLRLDLDHLRLLHPPGTPQLREQLQPDPRTLPVLSLDIRALQLDDRHLGALALDTRRLPDGMRVERLELSAPAYRVHAQGDWRQPATGASLSHFELQLEQGDLGALLELLRHERVMESRRANARLVANWPGSPFDFNLDQVEGRLDLDIGAGQLVKLDAPAGRMLNILSIHSLQRRLVLDFSDVLGKGFSFDQITGHVSFMAGDAYTQDLQVISPSARIHIAGRTGFVARDYDQLVTITPLVSSGLPIAGVLAGGPAVGAALFVAEKLFGERMNQLARYQYQVTGPWEAPRLERIDISPGSAAE